MMKNDINQHTGGLSKDYSNFLQNNNTHTFALNSIQQASDGNGYTIQSEPGNELCVELDEKIGHSIYIGDNTNLIFTQNTIGTLKDCVYNEIVNNTCLNIQFPIQSQFKVKAGCERTVYWTDHINPDRYINIDNLKIHKVNNEFDCNKFNIQSSIITPCINTNINSTGNLQESNYSIQIQYFDENNNIKYKSEISTPIYIYDKGGVDINITNIDTTFPYFKIILITTSDNTPQAYLNETLFQTQDTFNYTINSIDNLLEIDYTETLIPIFNIRSSKAIEQVQDRLIRANIKQDNRDYSNYQKFASKIKTYYKLGNNNTSFMPNEIYARGIVYIHTDGTLSPTFHIPGRCADISVEQCNVINKLVIFGSPKEFRVLYKVNNERKSFIGKLKVNEELIIEETCDIISDVSIAFSGFTPVEYRIDIEQTNFNCNNPLDKIYKDGEEFNYFQLNNTFCPITNEKGYMGYYHCNTTYDNPINICNDLDYWGIDSCGNNLLNTPIRHHVMPIVDVGQSISIESDNIEYPDDVVGHYFVYSNSKRIQDSGILGKLRKNEDKEVFIYHDTDTDSEWNYFISPRILNGQILDGQLYISHSVDYNKTIEEKEYKADPDIFIGYRNLNFTTSTIINELIDIEEIEYLRPAETKDDLVNLSLNLPLQYIKADVDSLTSNRSSRYADKLYYAQIIQDNDNLCNLYNINYSKFDNCINNTTTINGDTFINDLKYLNTTISNIQEQQLDDYLNRLLNLTISSATIIAGILTGNFGVAIGGVVKYIQTEIQFISNIIKEFKDGQYEGVQNNTDGDFNGSNAFGTFFGGEYYFANEYVTNFKTHNYINYRREDIDIECSNFYDEDNLNTLLQYLENKLLQYNEETSKYEPKVFPCLEYYSYNTDLSITSYNKYVTLPQQYKYCSDCLNHNPYRIVFSPRSFLEELQDTYLELLSEDYIDIPANKGEIIALKYKNNQLLVHTTETTFILKPYPQTIGTDTENIYIKTDDLFSIPASELIQTDTGFAGLQNSDARVNSNSSYIWVDNINGEIFKFDNKIEEISKLGLEQFFKNNLPQNKTTLTYDPRFERTIICSEMFTISYSHKFQSWISFHSYLPDYSFYNNTHYFTTIDNAIYKHNHKCNYNNFYNTQYPFIIEYIESDLITHILQSIHWYCKVEENCSLKLLNESYTNAIIYNSCQSTGILDINIANQNNPYINSYGKVIITDKNHKLSGLHDNATDITVFNETFPIITTDKTFINTTVKSPYEIGYLKDKYHFVRLINNNNNRITHFITINNKMDSIR